MSSPRFMPGPGTDAAEVRLSRFRSASGVEEVHLTVQPRSQGSVESQWASLFAAYEDAITNLGWKMQTAVFRRFFCRDAATGLAAGARHDEPAAESWVIQPPFPPAAMALWACHVRDPRGPLRKTWDGRTLTLHRDGLDHHWTTGLASPEKSTVEAETMSLLRKYTRELAVRKLSLADHVVRTWFYVRGIDRNYSAMVEPRRVYFEEWGMTPETHYVASTGIEGASSNPRTNVLLDAYAVSGLQPKQIRFLKARDHLSPTHVYGVTFERGTAITYPDRTHITISGTASIDHHGDILFPGDMVCQMDRALLNIEALLTEAGAGLDAMQVFTVYLRYPKDRALALHRMRERFPHIPIIVVTAPVCRPGWLIEIEGEALARL